MVFGFCFVMGWGCRVWQQVRGARSQGGGGRPRRRAPNVYWEPRRAGPQRALGVLTDTLASRYRV